MRRIRAGLDRGAGLTTRDAGLWRHRDFLMLWAAQSISSVGARIAREGLPMTAVILLRAPPAAMGALSAVGLAAYALVGVIAGTLADRLPRRALMIGADLGRMLVMFAAPAAALAGRLDIAGVAVALALMSALTVVFDVADHAFLPQLIDRAQLMDGNAKLAATDAVAEIGGPAIAGVLFQILTAPIAVALSALTYLASALCLFAVRPTKSNASDAPDEPARLDVGSGFGQVLAHPIVRPIWLMAIAGDFFGWFFGALYILFCLDDARLTTSELGVTIAAGGVGALAGAWIAPKVSRRLGAGATIVWASLSMGASAFLIPLAGGPPLVAMAVLIAGQLLGDSIRAVRDISQTSLRQAVLPPEALGRTAGAFATGQGLAGFAGALVGGALGQMIGPRDTLYVAAAGVAATALIGFASPLRKAVASA